MLSILPIPNITSGTPEQQLTQVRSYLIRLRTELEFALMNLDEDNFTPETLKRFTSGTGRAITNMSLDMETGILTIE